MPDRASTLGEVNMTPNAPASAANGLAPAKVIGVMVAASIASTIGGLPFNSLPVMLGTLAEAFKLDPAAVGFMGSVCFAGYLVGTLGAPLWIERLNWRLGGLFRPERPHHGLEGPVRRLGSDRLLRLHDDLSGHAHPDRPA
jgi:hypothetical protein